MAEEHAGEKVGEEVRDRGLFDFLGKKDEGKCEEGAAAVKPEVEKAEGEGKSQEEVLVTQFEEKVQLTEEEEEKKGGLLEKLHRSHSSSSSSSSDEEDAAEGQGEKKKKKKKSLKDKIKEKIAGEKKGEAAEEHKDEKAEATAAVVVEDNTVPVEKIHELAPPESDLQAQEKKSLLDKIKEKLPGGKKPALEEAASAAAAAPVADQSEEHHEGESPKEKKGFLGKIMDKIPGYHKGSGAQEEGGGAAGH